MHFALIYETLNETKLDCVIFAFKMISEFERYIQRILPLIVRVTPLLTIEEINSAFLHLMGGYYQSFNELGLGPLEYVLFRIPCVYFNEEGRYFAFGDIVESSDDSFSTSDDASSEEDEESCDDSGIVV
ncbi:hypothetical protein ABEB36_013761 [Hypothenemus hampei]|uniref:Uncharacterized protein n=1 Tax=Hypothenemus hampei TaxID=57062 RepID=A0ABD1E7Y2_HYPHA